MDETLVWTILGACLVVIIGLGCAGNVLSFLIWTKGKKCSKCQGAIYLRLLALSDILVLCIPAMELMIIMLDPTLLLRNLNQVFCEIFAASPYIFVQLSSWIVVSLTVEQTIAVCRPFSTIFKTSWIKWRQYGIVLVIALTSLVDNIPVISGFYWGQEDDPLSTEAPSKFAGTSPATVRPTVRGVTPYVKGHVEFNDACVGEIDSPAHVYIVQLGLMAIVPILTLALCNVIIITQLTIQNKKMKRLSALKKVTRSDSIIVAMTARTIAISVVQCVTAIPVVSMDLFFLVNPEEEERSETLLIYDICNTIYYLNNSINVVFYCILGRSFRQDCADLFSRKSKHDVTGMRENSANRRARLSLETVSSSVTFSSSFDSTTDNDCAIIKERL